MKLYFSPKAVGCFIFLFFFNIFLIHPSQSIEFKSEGTFIAQSTFITSADPESKRPDNPHQIYLPAGTRFIAYPKITKILGSNFKLILTEMGFWGYILETKYWDPKKDSRLAPDSPASAIIQRDFPKRECLGDADKFAEITLSPSEIYDIVGESDDDYKIRLTREKLGKLWGIYPDQIEIPKSIASKPPKKGMNLSARDIICFQQLPDVYFRKSNSKKVEPKPISVPGTTLLLVGSSPKSIGGRTTEAVSYGSEIKEISNAIGKSNNSNKITLLPPVYAATSKDLLDALDRHAPRIVHLMGHASKEGFLLETVCGSSTQATGDALRDLFDVYRGVRLVIISGCNSQELAKAISEVVDCAVGMREFWHQIPSETYAYRFYKNIAESESVQEAHARACSAVRVKDPETAYYKIPILFPEKANFQNLRLVRQEVPIDVLQEVNEINEIDGKYNVTRWYYTRSDGENGLYKVTALEDENTKKITRLYQNPQGNKFAPADTDKHVINGATDYYKIKEDPRLAAFQDHEQDFLISQCFKAEGRRPKR